MRRASALNRNVKNAKVLNVFSALRACRKGGARLELEEVVNDITGYLVPVIHNYGHGKKGICQHWGCCEEVCKIASTVYPIQSNL